MQSGDWDLGEYNIYKNGDGLEYEFWSYETENLSTAYFENVLYWHPITVPKWLWELSNDQDLL